MVKFSACLLVTVLLSTGCTQSNEEGKTSLPTESQVSRCISEMHLNPQINITALGFKLEDSGPDDAIWFKFRTNTLNPQEIFDSKIVHISEFESDYTFIYTMENLAWWDVQDRVLLGDQVILPNAEIMNVGIDQSNSSYTTIYIMWHET